MYCKFCGNPVDRKAMKCTACGKPVGLLSGGNSFTQMLQGKPNNTDNAAVQPVKPGKIDQQMASIAVDVRDIKKRVHEKKPNYTAFFSAFCAMICVISLVSFFMLSAKNRRSIEGLSEAFGIFTDVTDSKLADIDLALNKEAEAVEKAMENVTGFVPTESSITKNPESESNVTPGVTTIAFICRASGKGLRFSWLKYSVETNFWITINKDNSDYEIISSSGESRLTVINANPAHVGTYICLVEDQDGHTLYSAPAQFTIASHFEGNAEGPNPRNDNNSSPSDENDESTQDGGLKLPVGGPV